MDKQIYHTPQSLAKQLGISVNQFKRLANERKFPRINIAGSSSTRKMYRYDRAKVLEIMGATESVA